MHTHLLHIPHFLPILILLIPHFLFLSTRSAIPYSTEILPLPGCILDIQIHSLFKDDAFEFPKYYVALKLR